MIATMLHTKCYIMCKECLYLTRHDFSIDATDLNASIEASLVMSVYNITPPSFVSSSSTIVGSLFPKM
jgi:hypothetical protein